VSGPEPAAVPPGAPTSWRQRLQPIRDLVATPTGLAVVALVLGIAIGLVVGELRHDDTYDRARRAVDTALLPLAVDADNIWTSSDARPSVSSALLALRADDPDPLLVERHLDEWLDAYDNAIIVIAGLDLPSNARQVQRQVIAGLTLSRDAVEVLGHAAEVSRADDVDGATDQQVQVEELLVEVGRLRQRSEQLLQAARAASGDLVGDDRRIRPDVGPLESVTPFPSRPG
jgi:hypothetical protein